MIFDVISSCDVRCDVILWWSKLEGKVDLDQDVLEPAFWPFFSQYGVVGSFSFLLNPSGLSVRSFTTHESSRCSRIFLMMWFDSSSIWIHYKLLCQSWILLTFDLSHLWYDVTAGWRRRRREGLIQKFSVGVFTRYGVMVGRLVDWPIRKNGHTDRQTYRQTKICEKTKNDRITLKIGG